MRASEETVLVHVEHEANVALRCSECGEVPGYDRAPERRWRHLDTCQFGTLLVAQIPRVR